MKIINVSIYPPPFGGVSNHSKRLLEYLLKNNVDTFLIDTSRIKKNQDKVVNINRKFVLFYLLRFPKSIVHFHGFDIKTLILMYLISFKHIVMVSLHNEWFLDQMKAGGVFKYRINCFMFRRIRKVLVPTMKCKELAINFIKDENRIAVIPAFIPPVEIPELESDEILIIRKKHKFLVSTNAFKIDFYKGVDVYGIDILIEMMNILCNEYHFDVVLVFLLPNIGNENYFQLMKEKIKNYELEDNFIFITEPLYESSSLWKISDLVLRATNTDGNSLTILESLNIGIPVIASDCVERPVGTILFKSRDIKDLIIRTKDVLENLDYYKQKIHGVRIENNAEKIKKIYDSLY